MTLPPYGPTSQPAFQDALKKQLEERPNLSDVNICIGPPSAGVSQVSKWVALLEIATAEKWASIGRLQKEENYKQTVLISVVTHDGDGDAVYGRNVAYNIKQEIADQLLLDPTVEGTVWQAQVQGTGKWMPRLGIQVVGADGQPTTDLSWREAALSFEILVKNRM